MATLVSILIPCYNGHTFLNKCFESILAQTYESLEIVIINDGSTDDSEFLIKSYYSQIAEKGYLIKYFKQENQGIAAAINFALKEMTGEYIMLYDVDDILMPDAVKAKAEFLDENLVYGMVRNNGYFVSPENLNDTSRLLVNSDIEKENEHIFEDIIYGRTNNLPSTYMVRASCLFKHLKDKDIYISRYGQNMQLMMPVAYHYRSGFIDKPLFKYLVHSKSHSHSGDAQRKLELMNGYESNRIGIIKMMDINEVLKEDFINKVNIVYHKIRLEFAHKNKMKELLIKEYKLLRKNKAASWQDTMFYIKGVLPWAYRAYLKLRLIFHSSKGG